MAHKRCKPHQHAVAAIGAEDVDAGHRVDDAALERRRPLALGAREEQP